MKKILIVVLCMGLILISGCQQTNENTNSTTNKCVVGGGVVTQSLCCQSATEFPNTCAIGACGCSPSNSKNIDVCDCGINSCWNGEKCVAR